jgi:4-amino-4-deoxy-L-arabinose transferase-like glycosyltransferase
MKFFNNPAIRKIIKSKALWAFLVLFVLFSFNAFSGITSVPFHPDESTQIFMSADFDLLRPNSHKTEMQSGESNSLRYHYRLIDAPLTRDLVGLGRWLTGQNTLLTDWDWSKTWEENRSAGALPGNDLLLVSRLAITLCLPFSLGLIFLIGRMMGGNLNGLFSLALLGSNALVLVHNRRAMAEGVLTLGICLAIWTFLVTDSRSWLAGLGMAFAFNAKQSSLALLPLGILAVIWNPGRSIQIKRACFSMLIYLFTFISVTFLLNPVFWSHPAQTLAASWNARQELIQRQTRETALLAPDQIMRTPVQRIGVLIRNLYLQPPAFYEVGNYRLQTESVEKEYSSHLSNNFFRDPISGGIFLFLTLLGLFYGIRNLQIAESSQKRNLVLVALGTFLQVAALLIAVPLPWQRYVVPVIPFICLWAGFAITHIVRGLLHVRITSMVA